MTVTDAAAAHATTHGNDRLGATHLGEGRTRFEVWAPRADAVEVVIGRRTVGLEAWDGGRHGAVVDDAGPGTHYFYRLHRSGHEPVDRADPASRWQPEGVHGPSAVDDARDFPWTDAGFAAPALSRQVLYELHVGTFSPSGTFDGVIEQLDHLTELGITTIELLPVWQFPGGRNWGYDGVLPAAVQDTYGGPEGLRRLVDAAHAVGIGVVLDVVHNHLGPEGNHLDDFGPYTTQRHTSPWGPAMNVDGPGSDQVRRWIIESVVGFVTDHHVDGFRLDAVHGIIDQSAVHLLEALTTAAKEAGRQLGKAVHVIAESDLSDPRLVRPVARGGYGLDAQWADDLHHLLHVALTGEQDGYYVDYTGLGDLVGMLRNRYVYAGRYSHHRDRTIGRPAPDLGYDQLVVCAQNHDQVGNRMLGERLSTLTDAADCRFAAALLLTAPFTPMLFMGEEYAETSPFQYFVSHTDPSLQEAVRTGRRAEFSAFSWQGEAPDPNDPATFERSRTDVSKARVPGPHARMFDLYRHLIGLRLSWPVLTDPAGPDPDVHPGMRDQAIALHRARGGEAVVIAANARRDDVTLDLDRSGGPWSSDTERPWRLLLDTSASRWGGDGGRHVQATAGGGVHVTVPARTVLVLGRSARAGSIGSVP